MPSRLTVLSGPSGVGKGTVVAAVRELYPHVWVSVSCTTRRRARARRDGVEYQFVTATEFDAHGRRPASCSSGPSSPATSTARPRARSSSGWRRASRPCSRSNCRAPGRCAAAMPDALLVFLAPPSWDELERRLTGRGTEVAPR